MKQYFSFRLLLIAVVCLFFAATLAQAQARKKPADKRALLQPTSEIMWNDVQEVDGAQQAILWGDPKKTAHGSLTKFTGGTEVSLHTHSAAGRSIVIAGTVLIGLDGHSPKELGQGSYFFLPAGVKHTTGCKSGVDCQIFTYWLGPFDVKPAQ